MPALSGEGTRSLKPGQNAERGGDSGLSHTTGTRWARGLQQEPLVQKSSLYTDL